jgi:hypothetical protein
MAKDLKALDPMFADGEQDTSQGESLGQLDPLFDAPIGPAKSAAPSKGKGKTLFPELGMTQGEEKAIATGVGAVSGPMVQKGMAKLLPTKDMRTAEAVKKLQEEQRVKDMLQKLRDEELLKAGIQPEAAPSKAQTSGTKWYQNWAGGNKEIAGGVPEAAATYQRGKGQGPVTKKLTKKFGPDLFTSEPGQIKESLVDRLIRQGKEADAAAQARAAAMPAAEAAAQAKLAAATPGPLSKVANVAKAPIVGGALGGAGAGMSFYEAYQRYMAGDRTGAVLSALAGAGGLMSMVPGLQIPGIALGLGATGAQYAVDKYNEPAAPKADPMALPPPSVTPGSAQ